MATANPLQILGGDGLVSGGSMYHKHLSESLPDRSGSAPPSMEGSLAALDNLMRWQKNAGNSDSTESSSISEKQLCADAAYFAYYSSAGNLNPRLPHPVVSRESRKVMQQIGKSRDFTVSTHDASKKGQSILSRSVLRTHKEEEPEDLSSRLHSGFASYDVPSVPQPTSNSLTTNLEEAMKSNNRSSPSSHDLNANSDEADDAYCTSSQNSLVDMGKSSEVKAIPIDDNSQTSLSGNVPDRTSTSDGSAGKSILSQKKGTENDLLNRVAVSVAIALDGGNMDSHIEDLNTTKGNDSQNWNHHVQHGISRQQTSVLPKDQISTTFSEAPISGLTYTNNYSDMQFNTSQLLPMIGIPNSPLYASNSTLSPLYQNFQFPGYFTPQYVICGYPSMNPMVRPLIAAYPQGSFSALVENPLHNNVYGRPGASLGAYITGRAENTQSFKNNGQAVFLTQPLYTSNAHAQFGQHPHSPYASTSNSEVRPEADRDLANSVDKLKISSAAYLSAPRVNYPQGGLNSPTGKSGGYALPRKQTTSILEIQMPYPSGSSWQGQPLPTMYSPGRTNEAARSQHSYRYATTDSVVLKQQGADNSESCSFLDEFRSNRSRLYELSEIVGHVAEFSADQLGSRFIQQKLETCTIEEKEAVFREVIPYASSLMTDVFGNYVIQKFFEYGSTEQRRELAKKISGHMLQLSLQMYGCRVVQKALEVIDTDLKIQLVHELDCFVMRCVRDQNGNHVIQKCIECVPAEHIGFIVSSFHGQVAELSMHPYGCRVIQRVLENCSGSPLGQCVVDEIIRSASSLAQNQYGNYVTQHILAKGKDHERSQIISKFSGQIVTMSQNKFASNVIEKCFEHGSDAERELIISEIVEKTEGNGGLLGMMKDQFGNYVIQKLLKTCDDKQRDVLLSRVKAYLPALKKYTYGKHIVSQLEHLGSEGATEAECGSTQQEHAASQD